MRISDWSSDVCSSDLTNHPQIATRCAQLLSFRGLHRYANCEARLCEEAALALKSRDTRPAGTSSRDGAGGKAAIPPSRIWLVFLLLFLVNYLVVDLFFPGPDAPASISYTLFRAELAKDNIEAIHSEGQTIEGRFKAPVDWAPPGEQGQPSEAETREVVNFTTILPVFVDPGLESELIERKVDIRATPLQTGNSFLSLLLWSFRSEQPTSELQSLMRISYAVLCL